VHRGFNAQRVQPQRKRACLALTLRVKVFHDTVVLLLFLVERGETRPGVEEVCGEGEVQTRVAGNEGGGCEVLAAADLVSIDEDLFGTFAEVRGL
jgi:hypothetical protein